MRNLYYFKYFYFIARNWNISLAAFTVYHDIRGERRYRLNTMKVDRLHGQTIEGNNLRHASIYQASSYFLVEKAFDFFKKNALNGGLVDFGCGKGRVLVVAAHYGFRKITGIDFSPIFCAEAESNIERICGSFPNTVFEVHNIDAVNYKIAGEDNCFFFFNPFDEVVMLQVIRNLLASQKEYRRPVFIIYINPVHAELFLSAGFEEVWHYRKMEYLEFCLFRRDPELS